MPESAACPRIESPCIVGRGNVHYASDDDGRHFEPFGVRSMKDPSSAKAADIGCGDLVQGAVAAAGVVAVVGGPVGGGRLCEQVCRVHIDVGNNGSLTGLSALLCLAGNAEQT